MEVWREEPLVNKGAGGQLCDSYVRLPSHYHKVLVTVNLYRYFLCLCAGSR
jgi:hypothetical protein